MAYFILPDDEDDDEAAYADFMQYLNRDKAEDKALKTIHEQQAKEIPVTSLELVYKEFLDETLGPLENFDGIMEVY